MSNHPERLLILLLFPGLALACAEHRAASKDPAMKPTATAPQFKPLFPDSAALTKDWSVRLWSDIAQPAPDSAWELRDGILQCAKDRGSWLISNAEYSDFTLELDFRIGPEGNSGVA